MNPDIDAVATYLQSLQARITGALESVDTGARFRCDRWTRPEGGGGESRILRGGKVFEQAGVNFSQVTGSKLPASATAQRPELQDAEWAAAGLSLVLHPHNPYVPTTHANVRFFMACTPKASANPAMTWWLGGGYDLTPYYPFAEDVLHWHRTAQRACEPFGADVYARYKEWCDRYFFLKHRNETRGVGGLFFDDLHEWGFERCFEFQRSIGDSFLEAYLPILERRRDTPYGEREREFQLYRRGRYVEFNLVYDRGTLFGLHSNGRTESILMSLPPLARWQYDWHPDPGSPEEVLYEHYLHPRDWLRELPPRT